jgi:hypothetical protein
LCGDPLELRDSLSRVRRRTSLQMPDNLLEQSIDLADTFIHVCVTSKTSYQSSMSTFDYEASAELFAAQGRSGVRYRRFAQAAEAIRYAIEKLPPKVLAGTSLEVSDERYNAEQIRALYDSERYPLSRKKPSP